MEEGKSNGAEEISLGFNHLSVSTKHPIKALLYDVSGYVKKGRITAILGASAAGKSVLLQALSGRIQDLDISGDVFMEGKMVNPKRPDNPIAYVPQEDSLIGELTAREVTTNTALLKTNHSRAQIDADVSTLLDKLGLSHVADGIIGTLIFRGLSGGQKKRVEISSELIASPSVLLMDEPTSGLDSSIAFEVLNTVREIALASEGKLSVILSIHQPNSRILSLFDNIMLLERGTTIFFGSVPESLTYFSRIGFPCPPAVTPTDYFLQISDTNFSFVKDFDFEEAFRTSGEGIAVVQAMDEHKAYASKKGHEVVVKKEGASLFRKIHTLVYREYALAYRDPTLYYFQMFLMLMFAFLTGAIFFKLKREVDANFNIFPGSLVWLTYFFSWIHVFKVYHISRNDKRSKHEIANNKYSAFTIVFADSIVTGTLTVIFFGIGPIAYFMMGFPAKGYPFLIILLWMTSMASESMLSFITKFSTNPTTAMIFNQIALVTLMVFGGGVFIPWKDCPPWWIWLQESNVFTHSSRAMIMEVLKQFTFRCLLNSDGVCVSPGSGYTYKCTFYDPDGTHCQVNGREILYVVQGVGTKDNYWYYFCYLAAIFFCYRIGVLGFTIFPMDRIMSMVSTLFAESAEQHENALKSVHDSSRRSAANSRSAHAAKADGKGAYTTVEEGGEAAEVVERKLSKSNSFHSSSEAALTWSNLSVILPKTKAKLVDNVSGFVSCGRILALMGPSGAGKTTLLNGLANRAKYADLIGDVKFAGREMTSSDLTYVPQFDDVNGVLTVMEHILLVGSLTCADSTVMRERAEQLLEVLGLTEKRDTKVKNLSGGEVKRVSIGIGMISNPSVLFLDEPTTGLDSTAAYSIVKYLIVVAKATNVAVIMTIHQPSALIFDMLDDLLLLETGRVVYSGTIPDAKVYFSSIGFDNPLNINPADYYLDLVQNPHPSSTWADLFQSSEFNTKALDNLERAVNAKVTKQIPKQPSVFKRFFVMFKYFMTYFAKERGFYFNRMIALIIIAVFVGTLFLNLEAKTDKIVNYVGAMFFSVIAVMLTAISATAILAKDRRESVVRVENGMFTPGVYVAAQFLAMSIYDWGVAFIFVCIFHWLTNINPNHECFIYDIFINWGHLMLMEAVLNTTVEVLKNDFLSTTFGLVFLGSCMTVSGFYRKVSDSPAWINWMCYILPLRWSFDGFTWQIFYSQSFIETGSDPVVKLSGEKILNSVFDLHADSMNSWGMFGVLLGYVIVFRFQHYFLFALQTGKLPFMPSKGIQKPTGSSAKPVGGSVEMVLTEVAAEEA